MVRGSMWHVCMPILSSARLSVRVCLLVCVCARVRPSVRPSVRLFVRPFRPSVRPCMSVSELFRGVPPYASALFFELQLHSSTNTFSVAISFRDGVSGNTTIVYDL